uniref:Uncharacterized protein n=1 Tax=Arundo donax TaxID=35708 RepID=A0A0A9ADE4_ARUDO
MCPAHMPPPPPH